MDKQKREARVETVKTISARIWIDVEELARDLEIGPDEVNERMIKDEAREIFYEWLYDDRFNSFPVKVAIESTEYEEVV
jgi:hypothetical protein